MSAIKYALGHGFAPLTFAAPRVLFAGLTIAAISWHRTRRLPLVARRDLLPLLVVGVIGTCVNQLCFVYGLRFTAAATVALVSAMGPMLTGLLAHRSGTEIPRRADWFAAVLSFIGVILIVLASGAHFSSSLAGVLLALLASITWAIYAVGSTRLLRRYSPIHLSAATLLVGAVPLLCVAIEPLAHQRWTTITPMAWLAWSYSLAICYVLASITWLVAARRVGVTHAAVYQNAQTFLAVIFAVLVLSERIRALEILGGVAIAAGIASSLIGASDSSRPSGTHEPDVERGDDTTSLGAGRADRTRIPLASERRGPRA